MKNVKWAISTKINQRHGLPSLDDALKRNNINFFHCNYDEITKTYENIPYSIDECVVMYGPIEFIRNKDIGYTPGAFGFKKNMNVSNYMSQLPINWFFNEDVIWLPWGVILKQKQMLNDIFGKHLFIRPDSGFKKFAGFHCKLNELETILSAKQQTNNIELQEMCVISSGKPILGEYRIVICNGKVITGSQYQWDGNPDIRIDIHHDAFQMAAQVAAMDWQLDTCYIVDIFLSEDGPKIGEFNSFSSSGLYNCDLDIIVNEISKLALNISQ